MGDLQKRVNDAIDKARDRTANPNATFTATQDGIAALASWNQGLEDAIAEIVLEVEKITAALENKAPVTDK
jgi:hypothetical protein